MVSEAEIERLRLEADTIMTRYQTVEEALQQARNESGDHWEAGELTVTLETPQGESIEVVLDLDQDPAANAQQRYDGERVGSQARTATDRRWQARTTAGRSGGVSDSA